MCAAILTDSANGKRIARAHRARATSGAASATPSAREPVGAGWGRTSPSPGTRNIIGEMDCDAFRPPHPHRQVLATNAIARIASFHLDFTRALYARRRSWQLRNQRMRRFLHRLLLLWAALVPAGVHADPPSAAEAAARDRARQIFETARQAHASAPTNVVRAWEFARACYDWAEHATNDTQRAAVAREGIDITRAAIAVTPDSAPATYYLGLNLGQLARTKKLGALRIVSEMRDVFQRARALDPTFDYAGPDRCLGLLHRDAPGWPVSVGSRGLARKHLEQAVRLSPSYPENRLNLLEAALEWNDDTTSRREHAALEGLLPEARRQFAGDAWTSSWLDWNRRLETVRAKMPRTPRATRGSNPARR